MFVPPTTSATGFNCPHCGVLTSQEWSKLYTSKIDNEARTPFLPDSDWINAVKDDQSFTDKVKERAIEWAENMQTGLVFLEDLEDGKYVRQQANNIWLSCCYNCNKLSVWINSRLVFPSAREADAPNPDMPEDVVRDFEEARMIVGRSPRGAAALLRLCIQKICIALGEKGSKIDTDIANLVKKGLNPIVQRSLDVVRVVGNDSVHPGTMDLNDDRETALQLFKLVNLIAEQMISIPKSIDALYESLPEDKRKAITRRDGGAAT